MKTQRFDTSRNTVVTDVFSHLLYHVFSEKNYKENCTAAKFVFKLKSFEVKWQKVLILLTMRHSFLLEVCIEYKAEHQYCGIDWESVRNKYEEA